MHLSSNTTAATDVQHDGPQEWVGREITKLPLTLNLSQFSEVDVTMVFQSSLKEFDFKEKWQNFTGSSFSNVKTFKFSQFSMTVNSTSVHV